MKHFCGTFGQAWTQKSFVYNINKLAVDLDWPLEIMDSLSSGSSSFGLGLGSSIDGGGGVVTVTEFAKNKNKFVDLHSFL